MSRAWPRGALDGAERRLLLLAELTKLQWSVADKVGVVVDLKELLSRAEAVQHYAERPHIDFEIVLMPTDNFRRHVRCEGRKNMSCPG